MHFLIYVLIKTFCKKGLLKKMMKQIFVSVAAAPFLIIRLVVAVVVVAGVVVVAAALY